MRPLSPLSVVFGLALALLCLATMSKHVGAIPKILKTPDTKLPPIGQSKSFHHPTASSRAKQSIDRHRASKSAGPFVSRASGNASRAEVKVSELSRSLHRMSLTEFRMKAGHGSVRTSVAQSAVQGGQKREHDLQDIADMLRYGRCHRVIVMAGAGISTSSGIPDFRTPGTGLYDNLQKYRIPYPTAIFEMNFFLYNPKPFFCLAKELYPGRYKPNVVHYFLKLLDMKGVLLRTWTQNIDGLERMAGVPPKKLVEAHGTFNTASCTCCGKVQDARKVHADIMEDKIPRCDCTKRGICKPDIVFFGEDLPLRFYSLQRRDFQTCDLLLIMGTSLEVEPFASLVNSVHYNVPRVLFNRDLVGPFSHRRTRPWDVACAGDLTESVRKLVDLIGWSDDLESIMKGTMERPS